VVSLKHPCTFHTDVADSVTHIEVHFHDLQDKIPDFDVLFLWAFRFKFPRNINHTH
jgi:hypothetical protein